MSFNRDQAKKVIIRIRQRYRLSNCHSPLTCSHNLCTVLRETFQLVGKQNKFPCKNFNQQRINTVNLSAESIKSVIQRVRRELKIPVCRNNSSNCKHDLCYTLKSVLAVADAQCCILCDLTEQFKRLSIKSKW